MTAASLSKLEVLQISLLDALLASDTDYFRAGAECCPLPHATLYSMPALESLAAACVVTNIDTDAAAIDPTWLDDVENLLAERGCRHARFYQQQPARHLERRFLERGYRQTDEIAMILEANEFICPHSQPNIHLRPVITDRDWSLKVQLQRAIERGPDGHLSNTQQWVEMERQKHQAGYMDPFLIYSGADICGTVCLSLSDQIARLKNIMVLPQWRQQQIGTIVAARFGEFAALHAKVAAGCFAMANGAALQMYKKAGYQVVGRQTEWFKQI